MASLEEIVSEENINKHLQEVEVDTNKIDEILQKARDYKKLSLDEINILLNIKDKDDISKLLESAAYIKKKVYGNRVVIFAPLYINDFCENNCSYCGYKTVNKFKRNILDEASIKKEIKFMEAMGHKRIALELGEHKKADIEYTLKAIDTIYKNSDIRRINVNIAATTVENYKRLKDADIGTYILFQETYKRKDYKKYHISGAKSDYSYHLNALDRAMEGGIDDVGAGVLFGLSDYKYEILSLVAHNNFLEDKYNVGFHTVSVPRIKKALGNDMDDFYPISDDEFIKIVSILRLALPKSGLILSTREEESMRDLLVEHGVSQISIGSCTGVGGYEASHQENKSHQFEISDERPSLELLKLLLKKGIIPSYCTACYRVGRTGEKFMEYVKTSEIQDFCTPNAIVSLNEYGIDYGDEELRTLIDEVTENYLKGDTMKESKKEKTINFVRNSIEKLRKGAHNFYI